MSSESKIEMAEIHIQSHRERERERESAQRERAERAREKGKATGTGTNQTSEILRKISERHTEQANQVQQERK